MLTHVKFSGLLLLLGGPSSAHPATAVLGLDGILRVQRAELRNTTLTILHADGQVEVITKGLEHFKKEFPLRTYALFAFECSGCVTKQLYFDTYVPDNGLQNAPFEFPFEVTLEKPPPGQHFEYAGPVGYIRYRDDIKDFGYDTDYAKRADPLMAERMSAILSKVGSSPAALVPSPAPALASAPEPSPAVDRNVVVVPTLETRATLVHTTRLPAPDLGSVPVMKPDRMTETRARMPQGEALARSSAVTITKEHTPLSDRSAQVPEGVLRSPDGSSRSEELVVEQLRVTRIVRYLHKDKVTEFRRVTSKYGPVYYFKDGESCTQRTYEQGVMEDR